MKYDFTVSQELSELIERYQYEVFSRRNIIAHMLERGMDISSESFKKYEKDYQDYFVLYESVKQELEEQIPEVQDGLKKKSWNLDFQTSTVTVDYE